MPMARSRNGRRLPKPRAEQANSKPAARTKPIRLISTAIATRPAVTQAAPSLPPGWALSSLSSLSSPDAASSRKPPVQAW